MSSTNVPFFKRKGRGRPITARQRSASPSRPVPSNATNTRAITKSEVVLPTKRTTVNLLSAGSKRTVAQRDESDDSDATAQDGPDIKWTAEGSHVNAALEILAGDEAEDLIIKRRKEDAGEEQDLPDDGQYHGQKAYKNHIKKSQEVPKLMRVGPQRSSNTIRTVTITDYQPDVCKDYKGGYVPQLLHRL